MVAPIYADPASWIAWSGQDEAPDSFVSLVRSASRAVQAATGLWRYTVDGENLPIDANLMDAFRDATCAQISALVALDIDPAAGGTLEGGFETSVKIGSAQVQYTGAESVMAARQATGQGLCPESIGILQNAAQFAGVAVFG